MFWFIAIPSACFGAMIGIIAASLCAAAGQADSQIENQQSLEQLMDDYIDLEHLRKRGYFE